MTFKLSKSDLICEHLDIDTYIATQIEDVLLNE